MFRITPAVMVLGEVWQTVAYTPESLIRVQEVFYLYACHCVQHPLMLVLSFYSFQSRNWHHFKLLGHHWSSNTKNTVPIVCKLILVLPTFCLLKCWCGAFMPFQYKLVLLLVMLHMLEYASHICGKTLLLLQAWDAVHCIHSSGHTLIHGGFHHYLLLWHLHIHPSVTVTWGSGRVVWLLSCGCMSVYVKCWQYVSRSGIMWIVLQVIALIELSIECQMIVMQMYKIRFVLWSLWHED